MAFHLYHPGVVQGRRCQFQLTREDYVATGTG